MTNTNQFKTISTDVALEMLKRETAQELGLEYGADVSSRTNGKIGGEITRKLIALGEQRLVELMQEQGVDNVELSRMLNKQDENQLH